MKDIHTYYQLLGIAENASLEEIKKAFRVKAKQFHPDINPSLDAKQHFIEIHEAYEILLHNKTKLSYNTSKDTYQRSKKTDEEIINSAQNRATSFANQSYSSYKKTGYYSKSKLVKEAKFFVEIVFYFIVLIIIPIVLSFFIGVKYAFFAAIGLTIITMPDWIRMLNSAPAVSWERIKEGLKLARWPKVTLHGILFFVSLIVFLTIGFRTFIPMEQLMNPYWISFFILTLYLFFIKKYSYFKSIGYGLSITFITLNALLTLNYIVSFETKIETYDFETTTFRSYTRRGRSIRGRGSEIFLTNNKGFPIYDEYLSIRFFWLYGDIPNQAYNKIVYQTKEGLFGFKIYTDRKFISKPAEVFSE